VSGKGEKSQTDAEDETGVKKKGENRAFLRIGGQRPEKKGKTNRKEGRDANLEKAK